MWCWGQKEERNDPDFEGQRHKETFMPLSAQQAFAVLVLCVRAQVRFGGHGDLGSICGLFINATAPDRGESYEGSLDPTMTSVVGTRAFEDHLQGDE